MPPPVDKRVRKWVELLTITRRKLKFQMRATITQMRVTPSAQCQHV